MPFRKLGRQDSSFLCPRVLLLLHGLWATWTAQHIKLQGDCNVLLIFYFNCKQSWNIIEHIVLDTAEVIKVRGPHAVVSKTPDVSSLEKMSLIQHQWGREEKRQGWDDQQQIPLKLQQHDYSVQRKAAKGWIAEELQVSQRGMGPSAPQGGFKGASQTWTICSSPGSARNSLAWDFPQRKNGMLSHHIQTSNN